MVVVGGVTFFSVAMLVGIFSTIFVHAAFMKESYRETEQFWRSGFLGLAGERERLCFGVGWRTRWFLPLV